MKTWAIGYRSLCFALIAAINAFVGSPVFQYEMIQGTALVHDYLFSISYGPEYSKAGPGFGSSPFTSSTAFGQTKILLSNAPGFIHHGNCCHYWQAVQGGLLYGLPKRHIFMACDVAFRIANKAFSPFITFPHHHSGGFVPELYFVKAVGCELLYCQPNLINNQRNDPILLPVFFAIKCCICTNNKKAEPAGKRL